VVIQGKERSFGSEKASKGGENIYLGLTLIVKGRAIAWHVAEEIGNENKNIYRRSLQLKSLKKRSWTP